MSRRWQQAREQLRSHAQGLEAAERRAALDLLGRRASLCESVERQALGLGETDSAIDPEGARRAWSELPPLPDRALQEVMTARLSRALEAAGDLEGLATLRTGLGPNHERRRRLCLELEIAAGVESPPELNQERLRLQVQRLAERMAEGEGDRLKGVPELLVDWYRCGPAPADPGLDERLARVLATPAAIP